MDIIFGITILGFGLGIILGSFVKVAADRTLIGRSLLGRSGCPHCNHTLAWHDLVPLFSYLYLRGKCRYCHKKISIEYLLVEVLMGILIAYLFFTSFSNYQLLTTHYQLTIFLFELIFKIFFITVLSILFITDLRKMLIPDKIVLPAILISLIALITLTLYKILHLYFYLSQDLVGQYLLPPRNDYFFRHVLFTAEPLIKAVLSALLIGGFFWSLIIVTRGKGMGGGDVKLGALMGLGLGFPYSLIATMLSFLIGAIYSVLLVFLGKKHFKSSIAFGPFLVIGSIIVIFWGERLINWYLSI